MYKSKTYDFQHLCIQIINFSKYKFLSMNTNSSLRIWVKVCGYETKTGETVSHRQSKANPESTKQKKERQRARRKRQRAALMESNHHRKQIRLTAGNEDQALTKAVQGPNCPYQGVQYTILMKVNSLLKRYCKVSKNIFPKGEMILSPVLRKWMINLKGYWT